MSWLYSQVLVEEYSEANSLAGAPSALSSASPTPQAYSSPDRMKAFSRLSRYGMTFAPLTESLGADLLTWFLAGFPARTSARQEKERALTEPEADCGKKWRGLLVKWDQDMFSSKTVLCSEQEDSTLFSKTLPKWGMMLDGECWEQLTPVRLTKETECGLWGTPTVAGATGRWREAANLWTTGQATTEIRLTTRSVAEHHENVADTGSEGGQLSAGRELAAAKMARRSIARRGSAQNRGEWWSTEPAVGRVANGVAARVDRLKAIGNGQVPAVAALAWNVLKPIVELSW
jgi:hypothetical protein